ncbi:MAG: glycerol-3-phosphate dehydrogenase subunit GlpB [Natronomonas sp.]
MAIESDVLVVGGGLAGTTAAIAARRTGADVRLLSHKKSTLRQASGLIDALGYAPSRPAAPVGSGTVTQERTDVERLKADRGSYAGPFVSPYDGFEELPEDHPYRIVGPEALRDGLAVFDSITETYEGSHTEANALVPTFGGRLKPTARYPTATAAGLGSDERSMLVVGFRSLSDFDATVVADRLAAAAVPFDVAGIEVEFAEAFRADAKITRFAKALDHDEAIDGTPAREALADAVKRGLYDAETEITDPGRIGFPAFLGDDEATAVRAELSDRLGSDIFEIPMGPPSLPGLRLEDRLYAALGEEGVRYETGNPVVGYEAADGRIETVLVDRKGRNVPYGADSVVLATGGLVGKGLDSDREGVREPVFDCHVPHPEDRYEWFRTDALDDQPYARFGVVVDDALRPLDPNDDPEFDNLHAAGAVVGGADVAREKSASGVSLATGVTAGRAAATEANR